MQEISFNCKTWSWIRDKIKETFGSQCWMTLCRFLMVWQHFGLSVRKIWCKQDHGVEQVDITIFMIPAKFLVFLTLLVCSAEVCVTVNRTVTLQSACVCVCVSVFWARSVAPIPRRRATRCGRAGKPDSDPAGWTTKSGLSLRETPRSHLPGQPQNPAAPEPAPRVEGWGGGEQTLDAVLMERKSHLGRRIEGVQTWSSWSLSGRGWAAWPLGVGGADGGCPDDRGRVTEIPPSFLWYSMGDWRAVRCQTKTWAQIKSGWNWRLLDQN